MVEMKRSGLNSSIHGVELQFASKILADIMVDILTPQEPAVLTNGDL